MKYLKLSFTIVVHQPWILSLLSYYLLSFLGVRGKKYMLKKFFKRSVKKVQKDEKEVIGLKKFLAKMLKFFL